MHVGAVFRFVVFPVVDTATDENARNVNRPDYSFWHRRAQNMEKKKNRNRDLNKTLARRGVSVEDAPPSGGDRPSVKQWCRLCCVRLTRSGEVVHVPRLDVIKNVHTATGDSHRSRRPYKRIGRRGVCRFYFATF